MSWGNIYINIHRCIKTISCIYHKISKHLLVQSSYPHCADTTRPGYAQLEATEEELYPQKWKPVENKYQMWQEEVNQDRLYQKARWQDVNSWFYWKTMRETSRSQCNKCVLKIELQAETILILQHSENWASGIDIRAGRKLSKQRLC